MKRYRILWMIVLFALLTPHVLKGSSEILPQPMVRFSLQVLQITAFVYISRLFFIPQVVIT